jgi:aspartyl-tRNA(Asn)/glutamyl-tRNA(Gln) amidotransferase subunit C
MHMAKMTTGVVKKVASLASLPISEKEITKFQKELGDVLEYIGHLTEVKTDKVDPVSQTTGLTNILRNDKLEPSSVLTQEQALTGAKNKYNGYFVVPALLNRE